MKRDIIVFTLLASVLWFWIMLFFVAVFAPDIIYPTMYFRGMALLRVLLEGTVFACVIGICPAIAAGTLIAARTKAPARFTFLKVLAVAAAVALAATLIAFLPLRSYSEAQFLLLPLVFLCVFITITMSWLIIEGVKPLLALASRLASRNNA